MFAVSFLICVQLNMHMWVLTGIPNLYNTTVCEHLFCYAGLWIVLCGKYCFYSVLSVINSDWCTFQAEAMLKAYPPFVNYFEQTKETITKCDKSNTRFHAFLKVRSIHWVCCLVGFYLLAYSLAQWTASDWAQNMAISHFGYHSYHIPWFSSYFFVFFLKMVYIYK